MDTLTTVLPSAVVVSSPPEQAVSAAAAHRQTAAIFEDFIVTPSGFDAGYWTRSQTAVSVGNWA